MSACEFVDENSRRPPFYTLRPPPHTESSVARFGVHLQHASRRTKEGRGRGAAGRACVCMCARINLYMYVYVRVRIMRACASGLCLNTVVRRRRSSVRRADERSIPAAMWLPLLLCGRLRPCPTSI